MADRGDRRLWIAFGILIVMGVLTLAIVAVLTSKTTSGFAKQSSIEAQGNRRDCVSQLSTARRAVFDNVDIYKAIQIEQLSAVLLNAQQGIRPSQAEVDAFAANEILLQAALVEARRVQPPSVLDDLIAHGGIIDGRRYEACPGG